MSQFFPYLFVCLFKTLPNHCDRNLFLCRSRKKKTDLDAYMCYKAGHFSFEYFGMLGTSSRNSFLTATKITMFEFGKCLLDLNVVFGGYDETETRRHSSKSIKRRTLKGTVVKSKS